ncbi:MAG: hypothetical protein HQK53_03290 [Oligoflexia bacterium]|nr:hypothetical protein [Oligoflexia bacterium]
MTVCKWGLLFFCVFSMSIISKDGFGWLGKSEILDTARDLGTCTKELGESNGGKYDACNRVWKTVGCIGVFPANEYKNKVSIVQFEIVVHALQYIAGGKYDETGATLKEFRIDSINALTDPHCNFLLKKIMERFWEKVDQTSILYEEKYKSKYEEVLTQFKLKNTNETLVCGLSLNTKPNGVFATLTAHLSNFFIVTKAKEEDCKPQLDKMVASSSPAASSAAVSASGSSSAPVVSASATAASGTGLPEIVSPSAPVPPPSSLPAAKVESPKPQPSVVDKRPAAASSAPHDEVVARPSVAHTSKSSAIESPETVPSSVPVSPAVKVESPKLPEPPHVVDRPSVAESSAPHDEVVARPSVASTSSSAVVESQGSVPSSASVSLTVKAVSPPAPEPPVVDRPSTAAASSASHDDSVVGPTSSASVEPATAPPVANAVLDSASRPVDAVPPPRDVRAPPPPGVASGVRAPPPPNINNAARNIAAPPPIVKAASAVSQAATSSSMEDQARAPESSPLSDVRHEAGQRSAFLEQIRDPTKSKKLTHVEMQKSSQVTNEVSSDVKLLKARRAVIEADDDSDDESDDESDDGGPPAPAKRIADADAEAKKSAGIKQAAVSPEHGIAPVLASPPRAAEAVGRNQLFSNIRAGTKLNKVGIAAAEEKRAAKLKKAAADEAAAGALQQMIERAPKAKAPDDADSEFE